MEQEGSPGAPRKRPWLLCKKRATTRITQAKIRNIRIISHFRDGTVLSKPTWLKCSAFLTLGSAISITPFYSMNYNGLDANFSKALSNDFNRLGEKWANRRNVDESLSIAA